jgi:hypothetical protein
MGDDTTRVATYLHDLCNGMRTYAETDLCKAFLALQRHARSAQDHLELKRLYLEMTGLADLGDHQVLYERVLQLARKRGCMLTAGPELGEQTLIHAADPDAEPFTLDAAAPFDVQAAEIVFALAAVEMAHLPIDYGPKDPVNLRTLVAQVTTYCVLQALGVCYHNCVPSLVLAGVSPEAVWEWSSVVVELYSRLMQDLQA